MPNIRGVESFRGEVYHTGRWPHAWMGERGHALVEPPPAAEQEWTQHVHDTGRRMLFLGRSEKSGSPSWTRIELCVLLPHLEFVDFSQSYR